MCSPPEVPPEFVEAADFENLRHQSESKVMPLVLQGTWRAPTAKSEHASTIVIKNNNDVRYS